MKRPVEVDQIKALECKHAVYAAAQDKTDDDLLVIKENIHTTDGRILPHIHFIKNYERPFWITKTGYQNHESKKEWEPESRLNRFTTTQAKLRDSIGRAIGRFPLKGGMKQIFRNPYIYGADITTPTLIKREYQKRFPEVFCNNTVAVIDIETDVVKGTKEPIYVGITYRDKAYIASTEGFLGHIRNAEEKLYKKFWELLPDTAQARDIKLEVEICKSPGEACAKAIAKAHEWQPDFLSAWNMDFDIPKICECLEAYGYYLPDVFSDPKVPPRFRFYKYKRGPSEKMKADGEMMKIQPAERWHVVECPASFIVIDSMCLYRRIRIGDPKESYALDSQLERHVGARKLHFDDLVKEKPGSLPWHQEMQANHPIEYGVYNLFDCIGVELFDEIVQDLAQTISVQSKASEYKIFNSQPKRLVNDLYFFCREQKGLITATCSDQMVEELDQYVTGMDGYVITLPSHLRTSTGLKVIREMPDLETEVHSHVSDLDVASG